MPVSGKTLAGMKNSSWIRQMFEAGAILKQELGPENVFDMSIGNPVTEPPPEFIRQLAGITANPQPGMHRYMPNAGYPHAREAVARQLRTDYQLKIQVEDIVMTCGAAGAINVVLKTILNPGEEVIVFSPYFPEYLSYIDNHGGIPRIVGTGDNFMPDAGELSTVINTSTRAVIINSPNNPSGVMYSTGCLENLGCVLAEKSRQLGRVIYLISDEPYRRLIYDGLSYPPPIHFYSETIITHSFSKDLSLPGERIGYLALSPRASDCEQLRAGLVYSNRILGFVNAPALMQNVVAELQSVTVSVEEYQKKRDYIYAELAAAGYETVKPDGAFYLFPKTPVKDDVAFVKSLMQSGVLAVPGTGFGRAGHMRLSFCVEDRVIEGAVRGLKKAMEGVYERRAGS